MDKKMVEEVFLDMEFAIIMAHQSGTPYVYLKHETADKAFKIINELKKQMESRNSIANSEK